VSLPPAASPITELESASPIIELRGLGKVFESRAGRTEALHDVTLATSWPRSPKPAHEPALHVHGLPGCATLAMIGAVVSEFFGGPVKSLGVYIKSTASLFQTRQAWSAILVACVLGLAFYGAVAVVERLAMPWRADRDRA
jgi:hypothetical protein